MRIFNNCNIYNFFTTTSLQMDYRKYGFYPLINHNHRCGNTFVISIFKFISLLT